MPASDNGLSLLGLIFPNLRFSRVNIVRGTGALGPAESSNIDIIVMDDFLDEEPAEVPEPATLLLLGASAIARRPGQRLEAEGSYASARSSRSSATTSVPSAR